MISNLYSTRQGGMFFGHRVLDVLDKTGGENGWPLGTLYRCSHRRIYQGRAWAWSNSTRSSLCSRHTLCVFSTDKARAGTEGREWVVPKFLGSVDGRKRIWLSLFRTLDSRNVTTQTCTELRMQPASIDDTGTRLKNRSAVSFPEETMPRAGSGRTV